MLSECLVSRSPRPALSICVTWPALTPAAAEQERQSLLSLSAFFIAQAIGAQSLELLIPLTALVPALPLQCDTLMTRSGETEAPAAWSLSSTTEM